MKKVMRLGVAIAAFAALCGTALAAKKHSFDTKPFDFEKTAGFVREMETRPDFPVSTVLADDYASSLSTLGHPVAPAQKTALIAYLKKVQQDGGFRADTYDRTPTIVTTDLAVATAARLNATGAIDAPAAQRFAASLKNGDGGYGFSRVNRGSSLAATYHALSTLKALGALGTVDRSGTARFVKGFERRTGGFGYVKGGTASDVKSTFMALSILNTVGMLDDATRVAALRYLATTPYLDPRSKEMPELDDQLNAILALKELQAPERINRTLALSFLHKIYVPLNGGFGPLVGYGSTPDSTATALRVLREMKAIAAPAKGGTARKG